jgi:soluble lytic murein transglycosylase-like protein
MPWIVPTLIAVAIFSLFGSTMAQARPAAKLYRPAYWPKAWPTPPGEFLTAVESASKKYNIAPADLVAIGLIESGFKPHLPHKARPKTWAKLKDKPFVKTGKTWGQVYTEADCHAYGIMGVMPFNFIGVPGGLPVGTPLVRGEDITLNVHMAARLLRLHYDKTGDWVSAYHAYNPGGGDDYYQKFRKAKSEFEAATRGQV